MCHENEMGAAKEQHPYIICRLDKQRRWNSGGTVTRPLFICSVFAIAAKQRCLASPRRGYTKKPTAKAVFLNLHSCNTPNYL